MQTWTALTLVAAGLLQTNVALAQTPPAAARIVQTFAGTEFTFQSEGQPAVNAPLGTLQDVATDAAGNVYIVDLFYRVFRVKPDGTVQVLAGNGFEGCCSTGVPARNARLPRMHSVTAGPDGSVFIGGDGVLQKVSPDGILTTVATQVPGEPFLVTPRGMVFDAAGNLYVSTNSRIRKIDPDGKFTTIAGGGQGGDGPATSASLNFPTALRFDSAGNLYIADFSAGNIRRVTPQGTISTFATGFTPAGLDFDSAGNLIVADSNGSIVRLSPDGRTRTTIAGGTGAGFSGDGGPATAAQVNAPRGLKIDSAGNILFADSNNQRVRRITPAGVISTVAGNGLFRVSPEGALATSSFFQSPVGVAISPAGLVHVADRAAGSVYRVETDGTRTRIAGIGVSVLAAVTGPVPAKSTGLFAPDTLAFDRAGNLYIAEASISIVRRVTPDGTMTTYAGGGQADPGDGGQATAAALFNARGLYVDAAGNLYFSELNKPRIRRVTPAGIISTVAGNGVDGFRDGPGAQAQFSGPYGVAMDAAGNLFVADSDNNRIRRIAPDGTVSTVAQSTAALDIYPVGLAFDSTGGLLFAERNGHTVRRMAPGGALSLVAGNGQARFGGDGGPAPLASLNAPTSLALDTAGNIYVADSGNGRVRVILAGTPALSATPLSLSFTANSNAASPTPQQIAVTSSTVGLPFTITTQGAFLSVSLTSGSAPATVHVTVNLAGLAPGNYPGTITFTPAAGAPVSATVNLTVQTALPSKLTVDTTDLSFSFVRGGAAVGKRVLVNNAGGAAQAFNAVATTVTTPKWLSVSPAQGTATAAAPVSLNITADPTGLAPGAYTGSVTLSNAGITDIVVPVNMTVSNSGQLIQLSQRGLTFLSVVSGGTTPPQLISVVGTGQGSSAFTAKAIVPAGLPAWLSVTPASGTATPGLLAPTLTVSANPAGLAPGDYYGRIQVASPTADNSPREATVVLSVLAAASDPGILVQPSGLVFTGVAGGADPASQNVILTSLTPGSVSFGSAVATVDGGRYIQYQPSSGALQTGSFQLTVQPTLAGLAAGIYRGAVALVFSNGSIRNIAILIVIAPSGTVLGSTPESAPNLDREVTGCTPTQLLPLITSLGTGFSVPVSFPTSIIARVVDDCGSPHTEGVVSSSFSNGDLPLAMLSLGDGQWSTTWNSTNSTQASTTITATAENPRLKLKGEIKLPGGLTGNASPPVVGGVGAASFAPLAPLAPGGMVTVYGLRLSNGSAPAPRLPLDTLLAGTEVIVGGRSAPLLFSSDGQVNAILPYATPQNTPVQMVIARGNQFSIPVEVLIGTATPGIFSVAGNGQGQGHIYVAQADGSLRLATASAPARAGDTLVMYCSGLGPLDSAVADGGAAPLDRLVHTANPVTVRIGGTSVAASFAGLSPGFAVGLYQVNVVVPAGLTAGDTLPVVLTVAGQSSPAVTMAIR